MKKSSLALTAVLLASCSSNYMAPKAFELATKWCEPHGGLRSALYERRNSTWARITALCVNDITLETVIQRVEVER